MCVIPVEDDREPDSVFVERHLSSVQESTLVIEDNGHQVVYSVTTPFVVVVIVETEWKRVVILLELAEYSHELLDV